MEGSRMRTFLGAGLVLLGGLLLLRALAAPVAARTRRSSVLGATCSIPAREPSGIGPADPCRARAAATTSGSGVAAVDAGEVDVN